MRQNELHSDPNWILHNLSVLIDKEPLKIQIKKARNALISTFRAMK